MPTDLLLAPNHDRERSLGFLAAAWQEWFCVHGPGDIQGTPLRRTLPDAIPLSRELERHLADCYALDEDGRRLYDSVFLSRPKGWDKSGQAGRTAMFEGLGPCRFNGWARGGETYEFMDFRYEYEPGEPMGRPIVYPFIRIMATEEGQTGNVYDAVHFNLKEGPLREAFTREGDIGLTRTLLPGGGEIRPSTASSSAKDGGKETHINFDETHLYITNELKRMYAVVRRNLTKRKDAEGWSNETSTMYRPGTDSVAERTHSMAKRLRDDTKFRLPHRLLFDHREAPADTDVGDPMSLLAGLREAYGDADYMDFERLVAEFFDDRNDISEQRQYHLNQATAAIDAWVRPDQWDRLAVPRAIPPADAMIAVGFDGSKSGDWTALLAVDIETGWIWVLGLWNPADYGGEIPRAAVDYEVRRAFEMWDVVAFYADLREFESYVDDWHRMYGHQLVVGDPKNRVGYDMRSSRKGVIALEGFYSGIVDREVSHSGDKRLADHVKNCRRNPTPAGMLVRKPEDSMKIDAAVTAALAWQARRDYLALPEKQRRRRRRGSSGGTAHFD